MFGDKFCSSGAVTFDYILFIAIAISTYTGNASLPDLRHSIQKLKLLSLDMVRSVVAVYLTTLSCLFYDAETGLFSRVYDNLIFPCMKKNYQARVGLVYLNKGFVTYLLNRVQVIMLLYCVI